MTGSDMPEQLQKKMPHDVRLYVRNYWRHPNDPRRDYDFYDDSGEKFLWYLAADSGPLNPENWGDIVVLLFARGCLKTTTCTMIANWAMDCYPNAEGLVTAPRKTQVKEVMGRFARAAEDSGLADRRTTNAKFHQEFKQQYKDEQGNVRNAYSQLKGRTAWGGKEEAADALRGIHAHFGVVDEFQDVDEDMFGAFKHVVDRSVPSVPYFPTIFVIGTPKMANSFFHRLWEISDQQEWNEDEKTWEKTQDAVEYIPDEMREERERLNKQIQAMEEFIETEGPDEEIEQGIEDLKARRDAIKGFSVTGFHIDKYAVPIHDRASIAFDKANMSKRQFKNEVEAKFYTPENDLLTEDHIREAFVDGGWQLEPMDPEHRVVMGVDWGGGDAEGASSTEVTIMEIMDDETATVLRHDFFDHDLTPDEEVRKIESYIKQYDVETCVVDEGHGSAKRSGLQNGSLTVSEDGYEQVFGCQYGHVSNKEGVTWNRKGTTKRYFTVNRTFMIEKMVEDFKKLRIKIPSDDLDFAGRRSTGTRLLKELSAPYTDKVTTPDGKNKLRVISDTADDAFHSFVFAWIAWKHAGSRRQVRKVGSHERTGYSNSEWY